MYHFNLNPAFEVVTPPSAAVLSASDLNAHLRVDGTTENNLVDSYIAAATAMVETDSRLYLRPCELKLYLDAFPCRGPIRIARSPVQAITEVKYVDVAGDEAVLDEEAYRFDLVSRPARISPARLTTFPATACVSHAVSVSIDAGYAEDECPEIALQMIRLLVGHWFEHREAVGILTREIAFAYTALLERLSWD